MILREKEVPPKGWNEEVVVRTLSIHDEVREFMVKKLHVQSETEEERMNNAITVREYSDICVDNAELICAKVMFQRKVPPKLIIL